MKAAISFALICLALNGRAQSTPGKSIQGYTTKLGTPIHVGDTLLFGPGQRENGGYKYAEIPPNILITTGMSLPASYVNKKAIVLAIKEQTANRAINKNVVVVFKAGVYNARLNADAAEEAGEIITVNTPKQKAPGASASIADELIKLKSLLDSGVITQAEFDSQKAKLLNR